MTRTRTPLQSHRRNWRVIMREGDRGEQTASPVRLVGLVTGSAESLLVSGRLGVRETRWRSHDLGHVLKLSKAPRSREGHKPCARPPSQSRLRRPRAVAAVLRLAAEPGFAEGPTTVGARAVGLGLTSAGRALWEAVDWAC